MNELETQLSELVKRGLEVAEQTGEFVIEQAPLLLQEFYTWQIIQAVFCICVGVVVWVLWYQVSNLFGKKEPFVVIRHKGYSYEEKINSVLIRGKYYNPTNEYDIGELIFRKGGIFLFLPIFFVQAYKILFIVVAPKLYLINYFIN